MIQIDLDKILHQRIIDKCIPLYQEGQFSQAANESMKQVELAVKEKAGIREKLYGTNLVKQLFGSGRSIKLICPLEMDLQEQCESLFKGAFSYYRNYAAHDGSRINEIICIRIMVLASELLDIIGASNISFKEIGGVKGLIKKGVFDDELQISDLLSFLSSQVFPHDIFDGMWEILAEMGYTERQFQALFDLELMEYKFEIKDHSITGEPADYDTFGWFELTSIGQEALDHIQNSIK